MLYTATQTTPVGKVTMACRGESLTGLWLQGQKYFGGTLGRDVTECEELPVFNAVRRWLDKYFAGEHPKIDELPLAPEGSEFRRIVWRLLCKIPYGEVTTYGQIAKQAAVELGRAQMSAQAVGGAVGHNPVSIIIPCHRVIGSDGSLTGYAGGIDIKVKLLTHEGALTQDMYIPKKGTAL